MEGGENSFRAFHGLLGRLGAIFVDQSDHLVQVNYSAMGCTCLVTFWSFSRLGTLVELLGILNSKLRNLARFDRAVFSNKRTLFY